MPLGGFSRPELIDRQRFIREPYVLDSVNIHHVADQVRETWTENTNVTTTTTIPDVLDQYSYWTTHGTRIVDFHKHLKSGKLIPYTSYESFERSGQKTLGYIERVYGLAPNRTIDTIDLWSRLGEDEHRFVITREDMEVYMPSTSFTDYLLQGAAADITRDSHDTLTFIAELSKVRSLFAETVGKIARLEIPLGIKSVADAWLKGRYGWRTLQFDLDSLAKAVANLEKMEQHRLRKLKTGDAVVDTFTNVFHRVSVEGAYTSTYEVTVEDTVTVQGRGLVAADVAPPSFQFNPVTTAWELTPWSFVLDWLWDVGTVLAAFSNLTMSFHHYAARGILIDIDRVITREWESTTDPQLMSVDQTPQTAVSNGRLVKRIPANVPYFPQIRFNFDEWKIFDVLSFIFQRRK